MTVQTGQTRPCARCGRNIRVGHWVFSRHTRNHYCRDLDACRTRAATRARKQPPPIQSPNPLGSPPSNTPGRKGATAGLAAAPNQ